MEKFFDFLVSIPDRAANLAERDLTERELVIFFIIGAILSTYIYFVSSSEGNLLMLIIVAIVGGVIGAIILNFMRVIPMMLISCLLASSVIGLIAGVIWLLELLGSVVVWSR